MRQDGGNAQDGELILKGEAEDPSPPGSDTKIDLRNAYAIRRELASVYRGMRGGSIKSQDGTRLAYVLDLLRRSFETAELLARLEALELLKGISKRVDEDE